ncbi:MAG: putative toxin-antitoxin system toxin component, PIN family [Armatimonadota bacterium]|nr:putative toxin-antitoxin system toxin component, PIN family [Armatimonadota bacterium]MDR7471920.1 putative toxin-antitoxin system toxin component, PIN family [Armatimonadota bacterium]MDR7588601.1 putative toxin-antitoxin system toxin component, PIN family [Armatimonadota bacterium]MDR7612984.1 putative toxin-antitoxin system toxin component, PIN family [Armatimonadota bacterium]
MRIVLDTNVLISALAFPGSIPDQLLSRVRRGDAELFISPFILDEFERVLREKFRLSRREAAARVRAVRAMARVVHTTARVTVIRAKEDDNRILECAVAAEAEFLVTGDRTHLLPLGSYGKTRIVSPAQMLDILGIR